MDGNGNPEKGISVRFSEVSIADRHDFTEIPCPQRDMNRAAERGMNGVVQWI